MDFLSIKQFFHQNLRRENLSLQGRKEHRSFFRGFWQNNEEREAPHNTVVSSAFNYYRTEAIP